LSFEFLIPNNFSVEEKLIIGVTITSISWLIVTMITPPSSMETLQNFYKKIQPGGPGWRKVIDESEKKGIIITGKKEKWDVPNGILCMVFGSISVYSALFSVGFFLYGNFQYFFIVSLICLIFTFFTLYYFKKMSNN
jgi:hypothetical protein